MEVKIGPYPAEGQDPSTREIQVKIDSWDTWNLDYTLAQIILPALVEFKKLIIGYPSDFSIPGSEDYEQQSCFDFYREGAQEFNSAPSEHWKMIIDKMIWSFEHIAGKHSGENDSQDWQELYTEQNPVIKKGKTIEDIFEAIDTKDKNKGYIFSKDYYEVEKITNWEGINRHEEKIREGLMLFAKYYQHLWT